MFQESTRLLGHASTHDSERSVLFHAENTLNSAVAGGPQGGVTTHPCGPSVALRLDQERENRIVQAHEPDQFMSLVDRLQPGEVVLRVSRSGGPFDRYGARRIDVYRAQDLRALADHLPGRWVLITFTINRRLFLSPEFAYDRGNERIRKVMSEVAPKGIYMSAFELQTKTGEGWPHWHVLAWVPDGRTDEQLRKQAKRLWCMKTPEEIDTETGEVVRMSERVSLGFVDLEAARDSVATGAYVGKYLTKPFGAVPAWMGDSRRRFRKLRFSMHCYDVLERMHRHDRVRGSRRKPESGRPRRKTRTLFQRIAAGGAEMVAFRADDSGRLRFARTVPVSFDMIEDRLVPALKSFRSLRLGKPGRCAFAVRAAELNAWLERCGRDLRFECDAEVRKRIAIERRKWEQDQRERRAGKVTSQAVGIGDGCPEITENVVPPCGSLVG